MGPVTTNRRGLDAAGQMRGRRPIVERLDADYAFLERAVVYARQTGATIRLSALIDYDPETFRRVHDSMARLLGPKADEVIAMIRVGFPGVSNRQIAGIIRTETKHIRQNTNGHWMWKLHSDRYIFLGKNPVIEGLEKVAQRIESTLDQHCLDYSKQGPASFEERILMLATLKFPAYHHRPQAMDIVGRACAIAGEEEAERILSISDDTYELRNEYSRLKKLMSAQGKTKGNAARAVAGVTSVASEPGFEGYVSEHLSQRFQGRHRKKAIGVLMSIHNLAGRDVAMQVLRETQTLGEMQESLERITKTFDREVGLQRLLADRARGAEPDEQRKPPRQPPPRGHVDDS